VPARAGDDGTTLPISVIHGAGPGPVLALTAGVHGQEYTPVLALQRLLKTVDPKALTGTLILVHVSNMPSYLARTIYCSPADAKNLNRVFPGRADGTLSERIADVITREVIDRAAHVVDVHCGDGNESLRPYSYWITSGPPGVADAGKQMALAFGLDHIVVDRERPLDPKASIYLSNTAITRGKPALTIESGGMARTDEASIAAPHKTPPVRSLPTHGVPPYHTAVGARVLAIGSTPVRDAMERAAQLVPRGENEGRLVSPPRCNSPPPQPCTVWL